MFFLSFRGADTRNSFTSHLYKALNDGGINTFIDERGLDKGEVITPGLLAAIQESRFSVVILSRGYASSYACLTELAAIVKFKEENGLIIFPVFYDVNPYDVKKQTRNFQEAFVKHGNEKIVDFETIQSWRYALEQVGKILGWDLTINDRSEALAIREIVQNISDKLRFEYDSSSADDLIGIDERFMELSSMINKDLEGVRMIGICGMGGIGKTTLARVAYERLPMNSFDGKSFIENVRENWSKDPLRLQKQLLSETLKGDFSNLWNVKDAANLIRTRLRYRKMFIVIDDVDHKDQLKYLVANCSWVGSGSRIIITSRDEHLLIEHGVEAEDIYQLQTLSHDDALHLLSLKAFKRDQPDEVFMELCKTVVTHASGLPLALEVFGCHLYGRNEKEWESAVKRIKEDSGKEILDRLQISFDGLEETDRNIFLDIACFFKGMNKNDLTEIMDACEFQADIGLRNLVNRSLITVKGNIVRMHDLLQEMGRKIVRQASPKDPGKRSRLWDKDEIYDVLTTNAATMAVEAVMLDHKYPQKEENVPLINAEAFSNMKLRLFKWHQYPLKSLPQSFKPDKLVLLDMCCSRLEKLWGGAKPLRKLKSIDLRDSQNLLETPDLTEASNLEVLNFEGCVRLSKIHPSIGVLERLKSLNLKDCKSLKSLPSSINGLKSLETLNLSGCFKNEETDEVKCSRDLDIKGTSIQKPPSYIFYLQSLKVLTFRGCKDKQKKLLNFLFPWNLFARKDPNLPSFSGLRSLTRLNLSNCNLCEGSIPNDFGNLSSLTRLNLSNNNFRSLPSSIGQLPKLVDLELRSCKRLQSLTSLSNLSSLMYFDLSDCNLDEGVVPDNIGCLFSLRQLHLNNNNFISLPASIKQLSKLYTLNLQNCKMLQSLPELPPVFELYANGCVSLETSRHDTLIKCYRRCRLHFGGCVKLMVNENDGTVTILKRYLLQEARHFFEYVVPVAAGNGCEMQEWFSNQSEGDSITIKLPPHLQNNNEWIGFALSVVIDFQELPCSFYVYGSIEQEERLPLSLWLSKNDSPRRHQWICYVPKNCNYLYKGNRLGFHVKTHRRRCTINKCGIRILYMKDVEQIRRQQQAESHFNNHIHNSNFHVEEKGAQKNVVSSNSSQDCNQEQEQEAICLPLLFLNLCVLFMYLFLSFVI